MDPRRGCLAIIGVLLVLVGIPMLVCPGPGMLVIGLGLSLILTGRIAREMRSAEATPDDEMLDAEFQVLEAMPPEPIEVDAPPVDEPEA